MLTRRLPGIPQVSRPDKISAADIAAICQEAGMHAVRKNRCASTLSSSPFGSMRLGAMIWNARVVLRSDPVSVPPLNRYVILPKDFEKGACPCDAFSGGRLCCGCGAYSGFWRAPLSGARAGLRRRSVHAHSSSSRLQK